MVEIDYDELVQFSYFMSGFDDPEGDNGILNNIQSITRLINNWTCGETPENVGQMLEIITLSLMQRIWPVVFTYTDSKPEISYIQRRWC